MNCGYNYSGCGCNSYAPNYACNPFGCGGCGTGFVPFSGGCGTGNGIGWIAIVLVIFLILIIANIC